MALSEVHYKERTYTSSRVPSTRLLIGAKLNLISRGFEHSAEESGRLMAQQVFSLERSNIPEIGS